eukprot:m.355097 g.355097  ORF g.355097 m.355097 type:complete len:2186 (+) comp17178_c0_seq1:509-7066(+)
MMLVQQFTTIVASLALWCCVVSVAQNPTPPPPSPSPWPAWETEIPNHDGCQDNLFLPATACASSPCTVGFYCESDACIPCTKCTADNPFCINQCAPLDSCTSECGAPNSFCNSTLGTCQFCGSCIGELCGEFCANPLPAPQDIPPCVPSGVVQTIFFTNESELEAAINASNADCTKTIIKYAGSQGFISLEPTLLTTPATLDGLGGLALGAEFIIVSDDVTISGVAFVESEYPITVLEGNNVLLDQLIIYYSDTGIMVGEKAVDTKIQHTYLEGCSHSLLLHGVGTTLLNVTVDQFGSSIAVDVRNAINTVFDQCYIRGLISAVSTVGLTWLDSSIVQVGIDGEGLMGPQSVFKGVTNLAITRMNYTGSSPFLVQQSVGVTVSQSAFELGLGFTECFEAALKDSTIFGVFFVARSNGFELVDTTVMELAVVTSTVNFEASSSNLFNNTLFCFNQNVYVSDSVFDDSTVLAAYKNTGSLTFVDNSIGMLILFQQNQGTFLRNSLSQPSVEPSLILYNSSLTFGGTQVSDANTVVGALNAVDIIDCTGVTLQYNNIIGTNVSVNISLGSNAVTVQSNLIEGGFDTGIIVEAPGTLLKDNIVRGEAITTGIKALFSSTLEGNTIEDVAGSGVFIGQEVSGIVLNGNTISGVGEYGVYVSSFSSAVVRDSTISGSKKSGILVKETNSALIENCDISNNVDDGIVLQVSGNVVVNNSRIYANKRNGLACLGGEILLSLVGNVVGLATASAVSSSGNYRDGLVLACSVERFEFNIVSGNFRHGVFVRDNAYFGSFLGNIIGLNSLSNSAGNGRAGIHIDGTASLLNIGGTVSFGQTTGGDDPPPYSPNVISSNSLAGIWDEGYQSTISGNFIGTNRQGTSGRGNYDGIVLRGIQTIVGGSDGNKEKWNVISGNHHHGISILEGSLHTIQNNYVGLSANGLNPIPNFGVGIYAEEVEDLTIGRMRTLGHRRRATVPSDGALFIGASPVGIDLLRVIRITLQSLIAGVAFDTTTPLPNGIGIRITDSSDVAIEPAGAADGFLSIIANSDGSGLVLSQTTADFRYLALYGNNPDFTSDMTWSGPVVQPSALPESQAINVILSNLAYQGEYEFLFYETTVCDGAPGSLLGSTFLNFTVGASATMIERLEWVATPLTSGSFLTISVAANSTTFPTGMCVEYNNDTIADPLDICDLCTCEGTSVDCENQDLVTLLAIPASTTELNLGFNPLLNTTNLYARLSGLRNLEVLSLAFLLNPDVVSQPFLALYEANPLVSLDLSGNLISSFTMNMANHPSLKSFTVATNRLTTIPIVFSQGSVLSYLNLDINLISRLATGAFVGGGPNATSLEELSIRENPIERVDAGAFDGLGNLRALDLSSTLIFNVTWAPEVLLGLRSASGVNWVTDTCPQGWFQAFLGAALCLRCPVGTFAEEGTESLLACRACDAGTSDSDSDPVTQCVACDAGGFAAVGSAGACASLSCRPGWVDHDSDPSTPCEQCPAGTYAAGSLTCEECTGVETDHDFDPATECFACTAATVPQDHMGKCTISAAATIALGAGGGFIFLLLVILLVYNIVKRRKYKKRATQALKDAHASAATAMKSFDIDHQYAEKRFRSLEVQPERLTLIKELGHGEFGVVMLGRQVEEGDLVAIKQLNERGVSQEEQAKFLGECRLMAALEHPNIVSIVGVCTKELPIMAVLEFLEGGDLRDFLIKKRKESGRGGSIEPILPTSSLTRCCLDVCSAMEYLGTKKIVHRDLAARNVLVGKDIAVVKLADFGMSRQVEESEYIKSSSDRVPVKWMALESINEKKYTPASDVWSFGVLMWEVYSYGITPYPHLTAMECVAYIARGRRLEQPPQCPDDVFGLMLTCWASEPEDRPTFKALSESLVGMTQLETGSAYPTLQSPGAYPSIESGRYRQVKSHATPAGKSVYVEPNGQPSPTKEQRFELPNSVNSVPDFYAPQLEISKPLPGEDATGEFYAPQLSAQMALHNSTDLPASNTAAHEYLDLQDQVQASGPSVAKPVAPPRSPAAPRRKAHSTAPAVLDFSADDRFYEEPSAGQERHYVQPVIQETRLGQAPAEDRDYVQPGIGLQQAVAAARGSESVHKPSRKATQFTPPSKRKTQPQPATDGPNPYLDLDDPTIVQEVRDPEAYRIFQESQKPSSESVMTEVTDVSVDSREKRPSLRLDRDSHKGSLAL